MSTIIYTVIGDKLKKIFFFLLLFLFSFNKVWAIETSATSAILMDIDSGRVLYSKNINNQRTIASISKIMTAVVVLENTDIKKQVVIGNEIDKAHGSGIYIKKGEKLTIENLLYGLLLRSGNDAALALAYHTAGSIDKFVGLMNEKAKDLGMNNSVFNNPSGLDDDEDGNYSTAYDMALLMRYAYQNSTFRKIEKTKKYSLKTNKNTYVWHNKNKLLTKYIYADGGKTGFTKKAKRTLVTTASKGGMHLVVVTLNDGNDWQDHENLFEYGFNNYKTYQILKKGDFEVFNDNYYTNGSLYLKNDYYYTLLNNEKDSVILKIELEKKREFKNDMKVGVVNFYLGDDVIHKENIYYKKKIVKNKKWWELW